ncbi:MAG: hypothetical protein RL141_902 [Candidatus Parcubacteria bacterium]|jgi:O-antigen/teichoic acid export membrane protein
MEQIPEGVYQRSIQSGKWFMANIAVQKGLHLVTFFILARLLLPEDYGVMTLVMLVVGLLGQFTNPSFGDALLQRKEGVERFLDAVWTFELLRAVVLAAILTVCAPILGMWFHIPSALLVLFPLNGFLLILSAFSNARQMYFFRDLQFHKVFIRDISTQGAYAAVTIGYAAFIDASVWALFYGLVAQTVVGVVASYALHPARPGFSFQFMPLRSLWRFSRWVYGQDMLDALLAQIDKVFLGALLTTTEVGLYTRAQSVASTGTALVASLVTKVGFPAFSKLQDQLGKVQQGLLKSIDILLVTSLPISLLLLLEGGALVTLFLGPNWVGLVVPLKIFAFGNLFVAFVRVVNPILAALGRPDINFRTNILQVCVTVPLMYVGVRVAGVRGLAATIVVMWLALLAYVIWRARPVLNMPKRDFLPAIASGFAAGAGAFMVDVSLRVFTEATDVRMGILRAAIAGALYTVVLLGVSWRFRAGPWYTLRAILQGR